MAYVDKGKVAFRVYTVIMLAMAGVVVLAGGLAYQFVIHHKYVYDRQVAAGEWKIEMQTPPCDSVHNLQVIWPKESGAPLTVECDSMPVGER